MDYRSSICSSMGSSVNRVGEFVSISTREESAIHVARLVVDSYLYWVSVLSCIHYSLKFFPHLSRTDFSAGIIGQVSQTHFLIEPRLGYKVSELCRRCF
jgi:hypothetical protein